MDIIVGDLIELALDGRFDIIIHGCNCFCTMDAGIARAVKQEFPEAYAADLLTTKGDRSKLGNFSQAIIPQKEHPLTIINGYTQFHYYGNTLLLDYHAVETLFDLLKLTYPGRRFGYPKIGAGLAGGDWSRISQIIDKQLKGEDHTLVVLKT